MADPADNRDSAHWWQRIFTLRQITTDTYQSDPAHSGLQRLHGGQLAAQSVLAAAATVESDRFPHSLHTSFLHAGDAIRGINYQVSRARDSRSMSTRIVTAEQGGRTLASSVVSFHDAPSGSTHPPIEHEWPPTGGEPARPAPNPETLPSRSTSLSDRYGDGIPDQAAVDWPVDLRHIDHVPWSDSVAPPRNRIWLKTLDYPRRIAGADAAALAFATDLPMFEPVCFPSGMPWGDMIDSTTLLGATLNHSVWLHRPARLDDWMLLEQLAPIAHGYRAFCRGEIRSRVGQLVASVAQEMVFVAPRTFRRPDGPT
jgi:acyl-CoA thioesterase-2